MLNFDGIMIMKNKIVFIYGHDLILYYKEFRHMKMNQNVIWLNHLELV